MLTINNVASQTKPRGYLKFGKFIYLDHPQHATHILGGMWGFYNSRNRELASSIYNKITDKSIAAQYNQNSKKGLDQFFLSGK